MGLVCLHLKGVIRLFVSFDVLPFAILLLNPRSLRILVQVTTVTLLSCCSLHSFNVSFIQVFGSSSQKPSLSFRPINSAASVLSRCFRLQIHLSSWP